MPSLCYKKLMKLLIDRQMKQKDLCRMAGISTSTFARMKNGENVGTDILVKLCAALHCPIEDICEVEYKE